ncbi:MAG: metal-dependent transcriptional regulator [Candidatus Eisenbacteria bacterium]|uniref:Metal-dependent transcriptional regulator n=1 Tax=Eiseniibacteriota bacterium TaxID=2212470 RepID=A0A948WE93_UNCEI|nr:metal-dependent transcriptional regulator [Candidatus Eisenbacteria bacterium]MBU1949527.1 metal-dependent transcriptional regulator [Candidatus Eisenbacteria bacterium]MBU2692558.1 metal-dependent transcriptional regulator [Candidatus Eisenbacteria bacterium]
MTTEKNNPEENAGEQNNRNGLHHHAGRRETFRREERLDEGLECLYVLRENRLCGKEDFLKRCSEPDPEQLLKDLSEEKYLTIEAGSITLTPAGEKRARNILRRHRLAETLFQDFLCMSERDMETGACAFEHLLTEEAVQRVCTFLGHPSQCPHGRPIPPGDCCRIFNGAKDESSFVIPLANLNVGQWGKIVFMSPGPRKRIAHLSQYGIVPQAVIQLFQQRPSLLIRIGQTDLAIDEDIAKQIFVQPCTTPPIEGEEPQATRGWGFRRRLRRRGR